MAVRYEMRRQAAILAAGGRIHQETRHFHEDGYTSPGRDKETAEDYRYFPEPDLEPVAPSDELVEQLRGTIPELPWLSRKRIQDEWGVSDEVMRDLVNAGALDLVAATVDARRLQRGRPRLVGQLPGAEGQRGQVAVSRAGRSARRRWPRWSRWSTRASCRTSWPRQVVEGVLAGEGEPEQVMAAPWSGDGPRRFG